MYHKQTGSPNHTIAKTVTYVVVTDNAMMVMFLPHKLAVHSLIALIINEVVKRLTNGMKI